MLIPNDIREKWQLAELQRQQRHLSSSQQGSEAHVAARDQYNRARKAARREAKERLEQQAFDDPAAFVSSFNLRSSSHTVSQAAQERHVEQLLAPPLPAAAAAPQPPPQPPPDTRASEQASTPQAPASEAEQALVAAMDAPFTLQEVIEAAVRVPLRKSVIGPLAPWLLRPAPAAAGAHDVHLWACFVDFKQAFDRVPRDQLWQRLQQIGVGSGWLAAAQAISADVPMTVAGGSHIISTTIGVKQGCPLSPTLFGLYIDAIEAELRDALQRGVQLLLAELAPNLAVAVCCMQMTWRSWPPPQAYKPNSPSPALLRAPRPAHASADIGAPKRGFCLLHRGHLRPRSPTSAHRSL